MQEYTLPEKIRGEWIWSRDAFDELESFVFFRREFMLSETPASAELWLTANTFFHLYINGRYLGSGPPVSPTRDTYVVYLDVGFLTETGKNTIALLAHNTSVTRDASRRHPSGLWGQLNIDGKPFLWTDRNWTCWAADCFAQHRPRSSVSGAFTERLDFRYYPSGWYEKDFNSVRWKRPDYSQALGKAMGQLIPVTLPELSVRRREFEAIVSRGAWRQADAFTHVSFGEMTKERGRGVYVAETYLFSQAEGEQAFEFYSDDPFCFFVNGECCKRQGIRPLPTKADLQLVGSPCFRQGEVTDPDGEVFLERGWNRLLVAQQVEPGGAGFSLTFPDLEPAGLRLFREKDHENMIGWSLAGPVRTPLAHVTGSLSLRSLAKSIFVPSTREPCDESAFLMSCLFDGTEEVAEPPDTLELREGEFAILDLGTTVRGCPEMLVTGEDEDVVDIVCGGQLFEGQLLSFFDGQRHTDTIVLGPRAYQWMACHPRGMRYVMLVVRKASSVVRFQNCGVCAQEYDFDNAGSFECSDPLLNQIWEVGRETLRATMQSTCIASPTKDPAKYTADAMIQTWAGYHVFGSYQLAARSIKEFAEVQFETGEMPALCPSDVYLNMPDYSLLWPVWLQRHFLYTGDTEFLDSVLPALEALFSYYEQLGEEGSGLLHDLGTRCGAYCFLDHGPIDRRGCVTGLNAIYCRSLLSGANLYEEIGRTRVAQTLRVRAGKVASELRELTWDEARGLFADSWDDGEMSEFYSFQTNVLAIYGGVAPPDQYNNIFGKLFTPEEPFEFFAAGETNNPYFKYFILESAFALARREWAMKLMRWYWGEMVNRGARTWWELFDPEGNQNEIQTYSLCHGYGVSPNGFLCTELAGIRPAKPGFTTAYFNPLPGVAQWVKAKIPTPYGHILVEWEAKPDGEFEAVVDANYPLEVIPILDPRISESATVHVGPDVSILGSGE